MTNVTQSASGSFTQRRTQTWREARVSRDPRLSLGSVLVAGLVCAGLVIAAPSAAVPAAEGTAVVVDGLASADLSIHMGHSIPVTAGFSITYTITVLNSGPDAAADVAWSDTLPGPTTFITLSSPAGWSCSTPDVGAGGTVSCSIANLAVASATFSLAVHIPADVPDGTVLSNTATVSSPTSDPDGDDLSVTVTTTVRAIANMSANKVGTPNPVPPGANLTYTISLHNGGPSNAADVELYDQIPSGTTFVSIAGPAGWSCSPPVGDEALCSLASLPPGDAVFTLVVKASSDLIPGIHRIDNQGHFQSTTPRDTGHGPIFSTSNAVGNGIADISLTKTDSPDPVAPGSNLTYTITASNAGPSNAPSATLTDTVPAGTTFVSLSSPPGWSCVPPAVGAGGDVSCTHGYLPLGDHVFTLVVKVDAGTAPGTVIDNSASLTMLEFTDPNPGDTVATAQTTVGSGGSLGANVTGSKSVAGTFQTGSVITYTVTLENSGPGPQPDNPGDEFTDVLPAGLSLVGAAASSGVAVPFLGTNSVTWNGSIPSGGSVTIVITATIVDGDGASIVNQGTIAFDADGNGTNESSLQTDDPLTGTPGDATIFVVGGQAAAIPALDWRGLMALMALLAALAAAWVRRA